MIRAWFGIPLNSTSNGERVKKKLRPLCWLHSCGTISVVGRYTIQKWAQPCFAWQSITSTWFIKLLIRKLLIKYTFRVKITIQTVLQNHKPTWTWTVLPFYFELSIRAFPCTLAAIWLARKMRQKTFTQKNTNNSEMIEMKSNLKCHLWMFVSVVTSEKW